MPIRLDQKMLTGFVREAHSYLPQIHAGIQTFHQDATHAEGLTEALQHVHTIKGAAAMVGLAILSDLASYVAVTLENLLEAQHPLDTAHATWLHHTTDQLGQYLDSLLAADGQEQAIATAIEQSFYQLHSLPELSATTTGTASYLAHTRVPNEADVPPQMPCSQTDDDILAETAETAETLLAELSFDPVETSAPDLAMPLAPHGTSPNADDLDALIAAIDNDVRRVYGRYATQRSPHTGPLTTRHVLFTLAGGRYAVPVPHVLEIGRVPPITPVPNVPAWLRGVINVRGDILSVIDVRAFLGMAEGHPLEHCRLLVVQSADESLLTSLIVDQVVGIVPLPTTHMDAPQTCSEDRLTSYLNGVYEHNAQALAVFDLERFLRSSELRQFE